MLWLSLLLGCGETITLDMKLKDGQRVTLTDRVQNTVRSIDRGVILEGLRLRVNRDVTAAGVVGEQEVGWVERVQQVRVERAVGGQELVWDSALGGRPPEELGGALDLKSRVRDVRIGADRSVLIKQASADALAAGADPSMIATWDDPGHLDVVDIGLMHAPDGEVRVGQSWETEYLAITQFEGNAYESRLDTVWRVDRIDGNVIQMTQTSVLDKHAIPTEFGWVVSAARGRGTLVFNREVGLPTEYNEQVTYTMNSVDTEIDQMVTLNRFYSVD